MKKNICLFLLILAAAFLTTSLLPGEVACESQNFSIKIVNIETERVTFKFSGLTGKGGRLEAIVRNLQGEALGQAGKLYRAGYVFVSVPAVLKKDELAGYVLEYRLSARDTYQRQSLAFLADKLQTIILGQRDYMAGSRAALRIVVRNQDKDEPVKGARVQISLNDGGSEIFLFKEVTDRNGTVNPRFYFPESLEGTYPIKIKVDADFGVDEVEESISLSRSYRILLSTDKPLYQPGQVIHIRTLALIEPDGKPLADGKITVEVEDSKGNKVFKKIKQTGDFGVAAADFTLAEEVNQGRYKIRAQTGSAIQEKTVTVERYVLPRFKVEFKSDREYYRPGDTVEGEIQADYTFGKPVSYGNVEAKLSAFDVELKAFAEVSGTLDDKGNFVFNARLPDYFVGTPLEKGEAYLQVDVTVTDTAGHKQKLTRQLKVAASPLLITVVPEGGDLVTGITNNVFVACTYADGAPARVDLRITGPGEMSEQAQTDAAGFGEFQVLPADEKAIELLIEGGDEAGNRLSRRIKLAVKEQGEDALLIRIDKALYRVGDKMKIRAASTRKRGTVYIDLVRRGQTMLTYSLKLQGGQGELEVDLDAGLAGTLGVSGYLISRDGNIIRDRRLVIVDPASDLRIDARPDKESYLPGEEATINFQVSDEFGDPVLAALGLSVVDEAVFALQEMQPGMEKVYFYLEEQLLKPRYEVHGWDIETLFRPEPVPLPEPLPEPQAGAAGPEDSRQQAARILTAATAGLPDYSFKIDSYEKFKKDRQYQDYMREFMSAEIKVIEEGLYEFYRKYYKKKRLFFSGIDWDGKSPVTLEMLVENGLLTREDVIDPWGNPFKFEGKWDEKMALYRDMKIVSAGVDGIGGTEDDVSIPSDRAWRRAAEKEGIGRVLMRKLGVPMMLEGEILDEMGEGTMAVPSAAAAEAAPRVRRYFPETLYFNPLLLTDREGCAEVQIPLADSITTWRMSTIASTANGFLGSSSSGIRVFQDFFIDIDFPVALTRGDRVSVPVAVYNYLDKAQTVRIEAEPGEWFEFVGPKEQELKLEAGEVKAVYFSIEAAKIGRQAFTVYGYGERLSDAVSRTVDVMPDGREILVSDSGRLAGKITRKIDIPADAIEDASKIFVKIYPGVFAQVLEGLDGLLRMPFGCFEQTSSVTYPNVLILDYMKSTGKITPEIQMRAEGFINTGYQRLLSFEVEGGGFEWFGRAPANKILTAYGLMEFYDLARVYEIDTQVISRTQDWLLSKQEKDGSWVPERGGIAEGAINKFRNDVFRTTAYVMLSFCETGKKDLPAVREAVKYMEKHSERIGDNYTLALAAYAMASYDPNHKFTGELIAELLDKRVDENDFTYWKAAEDTPTHGRGRAAEVETSALACQALLKHGKNFEVISQINNYLIARKDPNGAWHSTQATVQALKALLQSARDAGRHIEGSIEVTINGQRAKTFAVDPESSEVMRLADLKEYTRKGENTVELEFKGEGAMFYQIVGRYYLHYAGQRIEMLPLSIDIGYDKTSLKRDDTVRVTATVANNRDAAAKMVIVDLGIPPGFALISHDLAEMVEKGVIEKFSPTGRQVIIYLREVPAQGKIVITYRLLAKYPIKAKSARMATYEYYNPDVKDEAPSVELTIKQ